MTASTVTELRLAFVGAWEDLDVSQRDALRDRKIRAGGSVADATARIIDDVRLRGDDALRELALRFDRARLATLEIPREEWSGALGRIDPSVRRALIRAARNIAIVHEAARPLVTEVEVEPGVVVGRRPDPLRRVGVYVPGGRATYPSSVLMGVVPARVAGVEEIVVATPPRADGSVADVALAAAAIGGATRLFTIGGAGAIAAMALGTETVPRVDRIVGPGNAYVAEAKCQLAGVVAIDSPAGPSELVVVADDTTDAALVATELVAQAEHDPDAIVIAAVVGDGADATVASLTEAVDRSPRGEIVRASLAANGRIIRFDTERAALEFANDFAPEHLLLATREPERLLPSVRQAGTVFVGASASVAFGDYVTGANHVLPTGGAARGFSGLSTSDFVRWTTYQRVSRDAAARLADDAAVLGDAESLPGHAAAARRWSAA